MFCQFSIPYVNYLFNYREPLLVTTACSPRQPNQALRAVRQSMNLSQREFAALIRTTGDQLGEPNGCTKALVQRWESGQSTICRPNYQRALQEATDTPFSRLGFRQAHSKSPGDTAPLPTDSTPCGDPSGHFRFALITPIQSTAEAITLVHSTVASFFDLDQHTPARILLPTVARHLDDIAALLHATDDKAQRQRLIASGGQTAALAGRLSLERGQAATAHRYWDSAMAAARDATDGPLLACVLMYLAHAALQRGDHGTAWQLAYGAMEHATEQPRVRAWIAVHTAQAAGRRGDIAAALTELKLAHDWDLEIGPPPAPNDTAPPWARFIDHAYLWAKTAHVHTLIGDANSAHHAAVRAIDTLSTNRTKTRAIILAEAAYAFAYLGGAERALHHATEALTLAQALEVTSAMQRLHEMTGLLPVKDGQHLRRRLEHVKP